MSIGHLVDDDERLLESSVVGLEIVEPQVMTDQGGAAVADHPAQSSRDLIFLIVFLSLVAIFMIAI